MLAARPFAVRFLSGDVVELPAAEWLPTGPEPSDGVDLKALTYEEMCAHDGIMQTTAKWMDGYGFGLGAEKNAGMSRLRLGYEIDLPEMAQRASWGIGLVGEGGSFEYGMAIPVGGGEGLAGLVNQLSIHLKAPDTSASSSF